MQQKQRPVALFFNGAECLKDYVVEHNTFLKGKH